MQTQIALLRIVDLHTAHQMTFARAPKISVITVSFNAADTIARTVQSVAAQNYPDVQHVVIDGGSYDATVDVVLQHLRIGGIVVSEPDGGLYDAMNKGVLLSSGDIVAILNADDYYANDTILSDVVALWAKSGCDAVLADIAFFLPNRPNHIARHYKSDRFRPSLIGWGWMPAHPGMFLSRRVYDTVGLYDTSYRIAADFEFVARAFGKHRCSYEFTHEVAVFMRLGGISTADFEAKMIINREVLRACRTNDIYSNWLMLLSKYPIKAMELIK